MGKTSIEWTQQTWNPVRGCSRVSEGCRNCYAEHIAARFSTHALQDGETPGGTFAGYAVMTPSGPRWTGEVELKPHMLEVPLRRKKPTTWFVNSMSDLFHEKLPDNDIDQIFAVMALCPQHRFQVLTKRAERIPKYFGDIPYRQEVIGIDAELRSGLDRHYDGPGTTPGYGITWRLPLPNVWLGVSVEDRANLKRIDYLRQAPAAVRFLSIEPLLEDLGTLDLSGIDWVIVGGESGPGARPMHPDWARSIRDRCVASGVPFFFKQWGQFRPIGCADIGSSDWDADAVNSADQNATVRVWLDGRVDDGNEEPQEDGAWFMEPVGKKAAGRTLDGRTWDQMPGGVR